MQFVTEVKFMLNGFESMLKNNEMLFVCNTKNNGILYDNHQSIDYPFGFEFNVLMTKH